MEDDLFFPYGNHAMLIFLVEQELELITLKNMSTKLSEMDRIILQFSLMKKSANSE